MVNKLEKYIISASLKSFFHLLISAIVILLVFQIARVITLTGGISFSFLSIFIMAILMIPNSIFTIIPILSLFSIYNVYSGFLNTNQIVIIKSIVKSKRSLMIGFSYIVIISMIISYVLSIFVLHKVGPMIKNEKVAMRESSLFAGLKQGKVSVFGNTAFYIDTITDNNSAEKMIIFDYDAQDKISFTSAKYVIFDETNIGIFVNMHESNSYEITSNDQGKDTISYGSSDLTRIKLSSILSKDDAEDGRDDRPQNLNIKTLINLYSKAPQYRKELNYRLIYPLLIPLSGFLIYSIISYQNTPRSRSGKIITITLIFSVFMILMSYIMMNAVAKLKFGALVISTIVGLVFTFYYRYIKINYEN
jgi:lipopolysaccharide export LptBFGC system permease protein LptF